VSFRKSQSLRSGRRFVRLVVLAVGVILIGFPLAEWFIGYIFKLSVTESNDEPWCIGSSEVYLIGEDRIRAGIAFMGLHGEVTRFKHSVWNVSH
jgi:hypothetical protein